MKRTVFCAIGLGGLLLASATPAVAQIDLTGSYATRMYEDIIERGPGEFLGNFTGMPMSDEGRAKALNYTSNQPDMIERQCLPQSAGVFQYRPVGFSIWKEFNADGDVVAWVIGGDNLRNDLRIWMDGRPHPSDNAQHTAGGFITGKWEGDTLTAVMTHLKTAWIRRGVGIPGSDDTKITLHITRHENWLTMTTIQEDPYYLTEPHVVSRIWELNPRGNGSFDRPQCNTANLIPDAEDTGQVPHYPVGENPNVKFMEEHYNLPPEAVLGYAKTLYPEYRKELKGKYTPPKSCDRYCCGWLERQGRPGAAPGLTCIDGGFSTLLTPDGRRPTDNPLFQK